MTEEELIGIIRNLVQTYGINCGVVLSLGPDSFIAQRCENEPEHVGILGTTRCSEHVDWFHRNNEKYTSF